MQKIIKLETENTPLERWTENSACEIYSHDTNNGQFEIEVMNEALTDETVTALFIFEESQSVWRTNGTIEENKIKFKFDTTLITQDETVICVLYLDNKRENNDFYRFTFKVKVSEIDKLDNLTVKERFFKNNLIVDRLDVVTKTELQEILKTLDLSSISTEGFLTEEKANSLYAKISELENYALKTNIPEPYNDTNIVSRLTELENKPNVDISNLATKEELAAVRGSQPNVDNLVTKEELENKHYISDVSNLATKEELNEVRNSRPTVDTSHLVTREELEEKHYLTTHQDLSEYVLKSELPQPYNDSELVQKIGQLEAKVDNDPIYGDSEVKRRLTEIESKPVVDTSVFVTDEKLNSKGYLTQQNLEPYALKSELPQPYNDNPLNERVTALESKAIEGGAYDDSDLRSRVVALESKTDNDTVYNDSEVKQRLTNLESIDTSKFITDEKLESKGYLKTHQDITGLATKEELKAKVNNSDYDTFKSMVVTKGYLDSKNYLTEQYNDKPLTDRVVALENKRDNDTIYDDSELKRRVTTLETRTENLVTKEELHEATEIDYSNIVTTDELEAKHYVTETELNNKGYLTQHQDISNLATKEEIKKFVTHEELPTPYNDTNLSNRVTALENKTDKDTVYNDTELRNRVSTLENRPNIEVSKLVTKDELASKGYLTTPYNDSVLAGRVTALENKPPVDLSNYALKSEIPQQYNDTALASRVSVLENKQDKDTIYNDTEVKRRLTALESRPTVKNGIRKPLVIGWQDIYIQNMRFTSQINLVDVANNVTLRSINGLDIRRVNNATYGYVIFNNRTKQFTLEILETDLSKKTSDDYLITVMWNNGYYTDNGALKNKR